MTTNLKDSATQVNSDEMVTATHLTEFFTRDGYFFTINRQHPCASFTVGNINNALKRGKNCVFYTVSSPYNPDAYPAHCRLLNMVDTLKELVLIIEEMYVEKKFDETTTIAGVNVIIRKNEEKGVRTWSPFANLNPLKTAPKRWNMTHVHRALLNGQFIDLKCDGKYSDDYAWDAADNFGRGALDAAVFVRKIIEHNSGWRVWEDKESGRINVNCHHFDSNSFVLRLAA